MTEEPSKQSQTISRDDLYREMSRTPASRLCAQCGISGRICDRLNLPSPPRGETEITRLLWCSFAITFDRRTKDQDLMMGKRFEKR
ncbi:MAG: hypothetical protein WCD52_24375 [Xanthobacteraceae bacterium]